MTRRWAALLLVLVAACGGDEESPETARSLADKLGCQGLEIEQEDTQREVGAREEGSCNLDGETLTILIYNTNSARDNTNKIAREFGSISVLGDKWAVRTNTQATAEKVKAALGGKIS